MPFVKGDFYTLSGNAKVLKTWQSNVLKYDSSSFYNWEQDNLPIYDLEDRTDFLWNRAGFPTSSMDGMALVVSADAPQDDLDCNANIFTSVSAAIQALPRTISFPIIIEVANFGNLGILEINDLNFEGNGSLEIVNQNFAKVYGASAVLTATYNTDIHQPRFITQITSLDVSNTLKNASAVTIEAPILSATADTRLYDATHTAAGNNIVWQVPGVESLGGSNGFITSRLHCFPGHTTAAIAGVATDNTFSAEIYGAAHKTYDGTIGTGLYDVSTVDMHGSKTLFRNTSTETDTKITGMWYGNELRECRIENCDGPIYIRNFFVDGTPQTAAHPQGSEVGFLINNSTVVLENCTAARCMNAGFEFNSSKVIASRGMVGYRNYKFETAAIRSASSVGAGLRMNNSHLTLSGFTLPQMVGGGEFGDSLGPSGTDLLVHFARNDVGVEANNSIIDGGIPEITAKKEEAMWFQASFNGRRRKNVNFDACTMPYESFGAGIVLNHSTFDIDGRLDVFNNTVGLEANDSVIKLTSWLIDNNQYEGMKLTDSTLIYNKDGASIVEWTPDNRAGGAYQLAASGNGQHIVADSSIIKPHYVSSMHTNFGKTRFHNHHGLDNPESIVSANALPAIELKNNTFAHLVHWFVQTKGQPYTRSGVFGLVASIKDNSKVRFTGSKKEPTTLQGGNTFDEMYRTAGVYVADNSEAEFNGRTALYKFGVDVFADRGSSVNFRPQRVKDGSYDVSGWGLEDTENHTSVELHATRACLVANNNSTINMEDLGAYHGLWAPYAASSIMSQADYNPADTNGTSSLTKGGSLQFYPNPAIDDTAVTNPAVDATWTQQAGGGDYYVSYMDHSASTFTPEIYPTAVANLVTSGGMCVRALNGSRVNVRNVHFPAGYPQTSGIYYDSDNKNSQLYIWNIDQSSQLHASYCSVSGHNPAGECYYYGPSSVYASAGNVIASGALSSTPDTSTLSVLDDFGKGGFAITDANAIATTHGETQHENRGPFRIYTSVNPMANEIWMVSAVDNNQVHGFKNANIVNGPAKQIFSQGYNLSADASGSSSALDIFPGLRKLTTWIATPVYGTSGFFYGNQMVGTGSGDRPVAILDESAANTFANAKQASKGGSNRPVFVRIYRAVTRVGGEAAEGYSVDDGYGAPMSGAGIRSLNFFDLEREEN